MHTLADVAAEAGVTKMTVSNVLNGRRDRVAPATFDRVMEAVERLGYVRNAVARSLSSKRSNIIAFVYTGERHDYRSLANPHDSLFLGELERHVSGSGLYLMVHASPNIESTASSLRSWNVDGAIFLGTMADEVAQFREGYDAPLVFVDSYGVSPLTSNVGIDDRRGGYLAGQFLARAGHQAIGFVGPDITPSGVIRQRYRGFVEALDENGLRLESDHTLRCDSYFDSAVETGRRLASMSGPPTAVFATADIIAAGLLKGLTLAGSSVPEQISIVGFDDSEVSRYVTPEITTIRQDIPGKARTAFEILLRQLTSWPDVQPERVVLDVSIVERGSVRTIPA